MSSKTNKCITLKHRIPSNSQPSLSDFEVSQVSMPSITANNQVLCKSLYLSVDPYMLFRMRGGSEFGGFEPGKPMCGSGIGIVTASSNPSYSENDIIVTLLDWDWPSMEYVIFDQKDLDNKIKVNDVRREYYSSLIGAVGMTGLTAYFGLLDIGKPKQGETLIVSSASGSVGTVAGQLGKIKGMKVIGITSTAEKGEMIKNELGFEDYILYKNKSKEDLISELRNKAPQGIDVYFDNVGGTISDAVIECMNNGGRIPVCGQISKYNEPGFSVEEVSPSIDRSIKEKNLHRECYLVGNYKSRFNEAFQFLLDNVNQGKIKSKETIYNGIENWGTAFVGLFEGKNTGKTIVKV